MDLIDIKQLDVALDRDNFLVRIIGNVSGTLEDVIGLEDSQGFITVVGTRLGSAINDEYREALGKSVLPPGVVPEVLVDLKRRIGGGFSIAEVTAERIVLVNDRCPFGDAVRGRTSLCMMTSNVFGRIVADNLGYAQVDLQKTIARGDGGCNVVIHLVPDDSTADTAREYFAEEA